MFTNEKQRKHASRRAKKRNNYEKVVNEIEYIVAYILKMIF